MSDDGRLFDPGPEPEPLSADRRRTLHNNEMLDQGIHPITGDALANNGHTCGDCDHCFRRGNVAGTFYKCELRWTGGPATDLRLKWPACIHWMPSTP